MWKDNIKLIFGWGRGPRPQPNINLNISICIALLAAVSCSQNTDDGTRAGSRKAKITIATAANAQFAMQEIEQNYEANQDSVDIELIISSSGKLTAQIQQGAPYDLFLSADMKYPDYLFREGLAKTAPQIYAQGALVVWSTSLQLDSTNWIKVLNQAAKIAIANPQLAPYGEQALNAFTFFQIKDKLQSKLVFGESISQTNQYILSGACEVGLTAKSVVLSPIIEEKGHWVNVPKEAYEPIKQGLVITQYGAKQHPLETQAFVNYLFSEDAKAILEKYGYIVR